MALTVYVADDDESWRELVTGILLAHCGANEVRGFDDGQSLLAALGEPGAPHPDLLLLDRRMPRMDGLDVLLERARRGWQMPIAILSSGVTAADADVCRSAGAFAVVVKPVGFSAVVAVLQMLAAGRAP